MLVNNKTWWNQTGHHVLGYLLPKDVHMKYLQHLNQDGYHTILCQRFFPTALRTSSTVMNSAFLFIHLLFPPSSSNISDVWLCVHEQWSSFLCVWSDFFFKDPYMTFTSFTMYLLPCEFSPRRGLHAANNCCQCSYFATFQFHLTSSWRTVEVWYLVSLEKATPEQIEQSGFNAVIQTILWP